MCDLGTPVPEGSEAPEMPERAAERELDDATLEPRTFVEEKGDFQQGETIQRDFATVAENLEPRLAETQEGEQTGSNEGSGELGPEGPGQLPHGDGIRMPGTERGGRGEETFVAESPWPDDEDVLAETAPSGLDGGGGTGFGGGEEEAEPGQSVSIGLDVGRPGADVEASAERVAAATPERPLSAPGASAAERPAASDGRTDQVPEGTGEPEKVPDTVVDAIDEVMRRMGEATRPGSGESASGDEGQQGSSSGSDSSAIGVDREGFVQGPGIPAWQRFPMTRDEIAQDLYDYCQSAFETEKPTDGDATSWVAKKAADYFEAKFGGNPEMAKYIAILREVAEVKTGQPAGKTIVTRVPPSSSDFIGPAGSKGTQPAGTTTWGSNPGTTTPAGTTTGGTMPGAPAGSSEKGGMREGRTPTESGSAPAAPEGTQASEQQEAAGAGGQEPSGGKEQPGDQPGGGEKPSEQPGQNDTPPNEQPGGQDEGGGGGETPEGPELEEPGGESPEPGTPDGGGGGGGSGDGGGSGGGGNGGSPGGDGGGGSGGGDDDGGDDDGDDDEGTTDSGGDEGGEEDEGMTVDGGSGSEPGRRQGSILGGTVPSGGGETQDAGREGPILEGGALGGGGGEGSGSDVGGQERLPIEGGTQVHPDSGGARPIDPIREAARIQQQKLNSQQVQKSKK